LNSSKYHHQHQQQHSVITSGWFVGRLKTRGKKKKKSERKIQVNQQCDGG
jgi:hypothetical protein